MNQDLFTDGIGNIQLVGGMVRIDLVSLQNSADGKVTGPVKVQRVVLSPEGFLQTFGTMQQFTTKMVDAGLLKKIEEPKS